MSNCFGRCVTAADVGFPEYGGSLYAVDPDCPEHGEPLTPEQEEMMPPDYDPGPCPCGDFEAGSNPDVCVCGHHRVKQHHLCSDGTSWWCTAVLS